MASADIGRQSGRAAPSNHDGLIRKTQLTPVSGFAKHGRVQASPLAEPRGQTRRSTSASGLLREAARVLGPVKPGGLTPNGLDGEMTSSV